jgi:hypothetical protein
MRPHRLVLVVLSTVCLASAVLAGPAAAAEVAYVDGGQIWVSTLDGSAKRSISGPSPDAKTWTETAQAENGTIIGVRREPGKMGTLNATRLWGPDGTVIGDGSLTAKPGRTSYAYPVTLSLSPDGKVVTYGYANWSGFGLGTTYEFGTYAEGSSSWYIEPFDVRAVRSGTLVGRRLVGVGGGAVAVQDPTGQPPYSEEFTGWFSSEADRVDVSASGTIAAVSLRVSGVERIGMVPFAGLGAPFPTDGSDCWLPTQGQAHGVSFSPDGTSMAWKDDRGVVVAGTPVWFATLEESTCNLSRPPVVISATGNYPSIGNSTFAVASQPSSPPPSPPPAGGAGTPASPAPETKKKGTGGGTEGSGSGADAPKLTGAPAKTVKASSLAKGLPLTVKVTKAGHLSATGKVGGALVAKGSAKARHAGKVKLRLVATRGWSKRLAGLSGKTLKISIKAPGGTLKLTRRLG